MKLLHLSRNLLFLIDSFLLDAVSYIRFSQLTCKGLRDDFKYSEKRISFVAVHLANFIRFEEGWVSKETLASSYKNKFGIGVKKRTGYSLKVLLIRLS